MDLCWKRQVLLINNNLFDKGRDKLIHLLGSMPDGVVNLISILGTLLGIVSLFIGILTYAKTSNVEKTIMQQKISKCFKAECEPLHSELNTYITQLENNDFKQQAFYEIDKIIKKICQYSKDENWNEKTDIEKCMDYYTKNFKTFLGLSQNNKNEDNAIPETAVELIQELHNLNNILEREGIIHDVRLYRRRSDKNK